MQILHIFKVEFLEIVYHVFLVLNPSFVPEKMGCFHYFVFVDAELLQNVFCWELFLQQSGEFHIRN